MCNIHSWDTLAANTMDFWQSIHIMIPLLLISLETFFASILLSVSSFSFCDLSRTRPGVSRKGPIDVYIYIYIYIYICNTVDGWHPIILLIRSSSHYLQGFIHPFGGSPDFWAMNKINQYMPLVFGIKDIYFMVQTWYSPQKITNVPWKMVVGSWKTILSCWNGLFLGDICSGLRGFQISYLASPQKRWSNLLPSRERPHIPHMEGGKSSGPSYL